MKTVTLDVRPSADSMADFAHAWKTGKPRKTARISFATPELLWRVLTEKRWELRCFAAQGRCPYARPHAVLNAT